MVLKKPNEYEIGKTIVYFVRHGDREHFVNRRGIGLEYPGPGLSKLGKKQAKQVAKEFSKIKSEIDKVYCSGMTRAIETAEEISKKIRKRPIKVRGLSEFNNVIWHGKPNRLKFWKHYFKYRKSKKAFNEILKKNKGKVLVIVVHGNVIKGIFGHKFGLSFKNIGRFNHNNCHITKLRFKRNNKIDWVYCFNSKGVIL